MAFPKRLLTEGETVVLQLRPHWIALAQAAAWTLIVAVAIGFIVGFALSPWLTLIPVVAWLPLSVRPFLRWRFTYFVVTNERVITRHGIIAKHSKEIPLETINDVTFNQSIFERIFNAGDLTIESAGEQGQNVFSHVRRPEHVQKEVYRASEARKGIGRAPAGATVAEQLETLAGLRSRGDLSDQEFEDQKRRLLGSA